MFLRIGKVGVGRDVFKLQRELAPLREPLPYWTIQLGIIGAVCPRVGGDG